MNIMSEVLRGPWAIEPMHALYYMQLIEKIQLRDEIPVELKSGYEKNEEIKTAHFGTSEEDGQKRVAVIPFRGIISKYSSSMSTGMDTITAMLQAADQDPSIGTIILKLDTPGGSAHASEQAAEVIAGMSTRVVAFVDGLAASGGMWLASQADEIVASTGNTIVGSIGTMMSYTDMSKLMEEKGIIQRDVYASASQDKNLFIRMVRDGKVDEAHQMLIEEMLDPMNETFIDAVKAGRGEKLKDGPDPFTGKTFRAAEALSFGLIDKIATFEATIEQEQKTQYKIERL